MPVQVSESLFYRKQHCLDPAELALSKLLSMGGT